MASNTVHCSLAYHNEKIDVLDVFAVGVRDGIFGNPALFPAPPVLQPDFQLLIDNYVNTRGAYKQGGASDKGPFLAARTALIDGLDQTATYVDSVALGDANVITEAGYAPTKMGSSDKPAPSQPVNVEIERGVSGELLTECPKVDFADYYGALLANSPIPPEIFINAGQIVVHDSDSGTSMAAPVPGVNGVRFIIDFNKSRKKKFTGLQSGTIYYIYYFAANASGVSALSDVRSLMCG